jgi:DNA sulfur modification protein DndD
MIIRYLKLHNFGIYANDNIFEFKNSKPIVLIGGMNGHGKTTFLEAVLLALYGANSFAYIESRIKSYGQYLKSYVNKADGTMLSFIDLEFTMDKFDNTIYLIHREWNGNGRRIHDTVTVKKNGVKDEFLTENWLMFIENILPSGLSNFFFFDGEKIAELAMDNSNDQMKKSIRAMVGITVIDLLESDINRVIKNVTKFKSNSTDMVKLEELRQLKDEAQSSLKECEANIEAVERKVTKVKKELENAHVDYTIKGGDVIAQQQELYQKKVILGSSINRSEELLLEAASSDLPLAMVPGLLKALKKQANIENTFKANKLVAEKIVNLFREYSDNKSIKLNSVQNFVDYVRIKAEENRTDIVLDITDQTLYQVSVLLDYKLKNIQVNTRKIIDSLIEQKKEAGVIDNYLSIDIDESALKRIFKKIKTLEQEQLILEVQIETLKKNHISLNGNVIRTQVEFNKYVGNLLSKLEISDDWDRALKYTNLITNILAEYRVRLQKRKIELLSSVMTKCYKKLANKQNFIENIFINPVTLDFVYFNKDKEEVDKEKLSAGEKQLMVISLLWALAICSKRKLPVIIDTPLSRMDSFHRSSLITTYFPNASEQTIILSTDSEIDKKYYNIIKKNVGDEFTLQYNEQTKSVIIEKGYFPGDFS